MVEHSAILEVRLAVLLPQARGFPWIGGGRTAGLPQFSAIGAGWKLGCCSTYRNLCLVVLRRWQKHGFRPQLSLVALLAVITVSALGVAGWVTASNSVSRNRELEEAADARIYVAAPVPRCIEGAFGTEFFEDIRLVRPEQIQVSLNLWIRDRQNAAIQDLLRLYPSLVELDIDSDNLDLVEPLLGVVYTNRLGHHPPETYIPTLEAIERVERVRLTCESHESLSFLSGLPHLRVLTVAVSPPTIWYEGEPDPRLGLRFLESLPKLRSLQVTWWNLGAGDPLYGDLTALGSLTSIEDLCLSHAKLSAADLAAVAKCQTLRSLSLWYCQTDDQDLGVLAQLPLLRMVDLTHCNTTDRGMGQLQSLPHLEQLCLDGLPITDAGLLELQHNKALRFLSVAGTQVTPEGVEQLRAELPALWIRTKK